MLVGLFAIVLCSLLMDEATNWLVFLPSFYDVLI